MTPPTNANDVELTAFDISHSSDKVSQISGSCRFLRDVVPNSPCKKPQRHGGQTTACLLINVYDYDEGRAYDGYKKIYLLTVSVMLYVKKDYIR